jgi:hypothetical protein
LIPARPVPRRAHLPFASIAGLACAGSLVASASGARAQVNVEVLRKRIKARGVSFVLEGTFDGHTGNTSGLTADGLVGGGFASGRHLAFAFASADYSKLNGTLGVDKSFAHARYDVEMVRWASWEAFVQAQSDSFQLLGVRNLFGTGPRFALYEDRFTGIYAGLAYMLERDAYDLAVGSPLTRTPVYSRWSSYLTLHATLRDGIDVVTTTYVQPRVEDPGDVRIESESGFVFKVTKVFSTGITLTAHYDSNPVPGVLRTDTELKNVLMLAL